MGRPIFVKPIINKRNQQCSINLPKKKMPKKLRDNIFKVNKIKLFLEGWE